MCSATHALYIVKMPVSRLPKAAPASPRRKGIKPARPRSAKQALSSGLETGFDPSPPLQRKGKAAKGPPVQAPQGAQAAHVDPVVEWSELAKWGLSGDERIRLSMAVIGANAEYPTPREVKELEDQGRDVLFSPAVLAELKSLPDLSVELARRPRVEGTTLTVDGYDSLDLDNALSFRREPDGTRVAEVIATDVAARVRLGSSLDYAARRRIETRYFEKEGLVLPMLPTSLSEGSMSLFEGRVRLVKVVEMRFSPDGKLVGHAVSNKVFTNQFRLDGEDAALARDGKGRGEGHPELVEALNELCKLGAALRGAGENDALSIKEMLAELTEKSAELVGQDLADQGIETFFRNQTKQNEPSTYGPEAKGHASLGARAYARWTAPMRRYADLDVQRAMDRLILGRSLEGRKEKLDRVGREAQLDRANGKGVDARLRYLDELVAVTRSFGRARGKKKQGG